MSIYSLTPLGAPPSDTVDHSVLDAEASDGMLLTRCATHARTARAVRGRGDCSVVVVGTSEVDAASLHSELSRMLA